MRTEATGVVEDQVDVMAQARRPRRTWTRHLAWGLAVGIALVLSGDRGARTSNHQGTDPLDILNLQVRANAIVVVDSSGSMGETLGAGDLGGDSLESKMYLAKQTLKTVIRDNERKVSFQFGQYKQPGVGGSTFGWCSITDTTSCTASSDCPSGESCVSGIMRVPVTGFGRFLYNTTSVRSPGMATNELTVDLRTYVVPAGQRMRMMENGTTLTDRAECAVAAGTYNNAFDFANAVATAMSNCGTGGNTYTVTVDTANSHRFRFTRATGTLSWSIRWSLMTGTYNTLRLFLVSTGTDSATQGSAAYVPASTPTTAIDLKRDASVGATNAGKFTENGVTFYKLYARRFFNGNTVRVRPDGVACSVNPLPGTTGVGGDGSAAGQEPWVDIELGTATCTAASPAQVERFTFSSVPRSTNFLGDANADGEWRAWTGNGTCGGFESLVALQDCTQNAQFNLIAPFLDNEIEIDRNTRWPVGYSENTVGTVTAQPAVGGMRAAGNTPIAQSLVDIDAEWEANLWPTISGYSTNGPFPKTFVIFLTDGDDTCETPTGGSALSDDQRALRAAHRAQLLYAAVDTSNTARAVASSVTTFVVAFGNGVSADRANWIAWGGSGMTRPTFDHGGTVGLRWAGVPPQSARDACTTCYDAFLAGDTEALGKALQIAIDQGQSVGTFSDQQSVTDSIFELAFVTGFEPRDPQTRYRASIPVLLQSTFGMPNFQGRLKAFRRGVSASVEEWDAGTKLRNRVVNGLTGTDGVGTGNWSYGELRGTGTDANIVSSNARIKRRIYTSSSNGVFQPTQTDLMNGTGPGRMTLWPAEATVDPNGAGGVFDDELGIAITAGPPAVTFATLQTTYAACTASVPADLPANCLPAAGVTAQRAHAVMEARRIILANMAGAELVKVGNLALRRTADKQLLFRARPWMLAESTLAAPAVVGPPPSEAPGLHGVEYNLFVNGPRSGGVAQDGVLRGFGLRDPDNDGNTASAGNSRLKPVMSVAYHAANDMLHAFRAGPCRNTSGNPSCLDGTTESGGEELWGFVPYDLLGNLKNLLIPQTRADHTFMIATPVRLTQVFVPGAWGPLSIGGASVQGEGLWRNVIIFGRGIGGKHLTALDITAPAPFTDGSLTARGPIVLWNRGNPDTQDGLATGTANNTVPGNTDAAVYAEMGETWSVPSVASVEASRNVTPRKSEGVEFVAYVGSGYSEVTTEGKRYYALDLLTGDVIASANVGNRATGLHPFENALVSGPVVFNELTLSNRDTAVNPFETVSTRVYFNDIHGRLFRVMTDDPATVAQIADVNDNANTVLHPLGVPPSLVFYADAGGTELPHIYVESGNDNRIFSPEAVPATTPPFKIWGLVDADLPSDPDSTDGVAGPVRVIFTRDFPNLYRGTTQPATAFNEGGLARVLFAGTRYNPPGTQFAPPPYPCRSSFDSILFVLGAGTGNAAFDLNASGQDEYIEYIQQQIKSVQVVGGQAIVDRGLNAEIAPTPPPSNTISPPVQGSVFQGLSVPGQFVVSHRETPFSGGSAVCR
jgi:hypothetical protein